jgi:FixJ family two-component response regulator
MSIKKRQLTSHSSSGEGSLSKVPLIAIVDDDDSFRRATTSFIRSLGYAVLQFASADSFLKSDRLHDTDCLISDVQMPGINGIELQRKLIVQGDRLPIVFVTAVSEMRARAQTLAAGLSVFWTNRSAMKN